MSVAVARQAEQLKSGHNACSRHFPGCRVVARIDTTLGSTTSREGQPVDLCAEHAPVVAYLERTPTLLGVMSRLLGLGGRATEASASKRAPEPHATRAASPG